LNRRPAALRRFFCEVDTMPKRPDLKKVLVIGSGPIIIGQAAEFDYAGTQACRALRQEGLEVVLVNSNPATIMTDPEIADRIYLEPLTVDFLTRILERERPQGLLATLGGQTGLNLAVELAERGVLERLGVELLGTKLSSIQKAEDRQLFKKTMEEIGMRVAPSGIATDLEQALALAAEIGYPVIVRPAFTLGGTGGGLAGNSAELERVATLGLKASPIGQILVEKSLAGWKEIEYEVVRDGADNCIAVCNMENLDPIGVHTGDSIVIAPSQTMSDRDYQRLRAASLRIIRALEVEGGCNVQFALNPQGDDFYVIEVNPRVSRSSALASKATGYPIAQVAARIAVGLRLDEIRNPITAKTTAAHEPALDYVVVKIPRWPFDKFPRADRSLGTQMKATGEVMAIDRTFEGALQKAIRSLELGTYGLAWKEAAGWTAEELEQLLAVPNDRRLWAVAEAFRRGQEVDRVYQLTGIDRYFLQKIRHLVGLEREIVAIAAARRAKEGLGAGEGQNPSAEGKNQSFGGSKPSSEGANLSPESRNTSSAAAEPLLPRDFLWELKRKGFSDRYLAALLEVQEDTVRAWREQYGLLPTYKMVDTCAAEFEAVTPYFYSCYELEDEAAVAFEVTSLKPASGSQGATELKTLAPSTSRELKKEVDGGVQADREPTGRAPRAEQRFELTGPILVLGSGPIRIGQGIEFDYCSVQALQALREEGLRSIIINNNPETVSTDFDTGDRLYFEPLTLEDVLNVAEKERVAGVLVQFGGQTALNLAEPLAKRGLTLLGTSLEGIDLAEDRQRFDCLLAELGIPRPAGGTATTLEGAKEVARAIGYPVMVRPSYVLGGRGMEIVYSEEDLVRYIQTAVEVTPEKPVLIDRYVLGREVEVDAVADGQEVLIAGIMEHVERAGIHSGDSLSLYPPRGLSHPVKGTIIDYTRRLARGLGIRGLLNIQFVLEGERVFVLEANPRASRTVPFLSKATGLPIVRLATRVMLGKTLREMGYSGGLWPQPEHVAVKAPVFSFAKLRLVDPYLGPEMKSTGEVMGLGQDYQEALYKAITAANLKWPEPGRVIVSLGERDKKEALPLLRDLTALGFTFLATEKTATFLESAGLPVTAFQKEDTSWLGYLRRGEVVMCINTPTAGQDPSRFGFQLRRTSAEFGVPFFTSLDTLRVVVEVLKEKSHLAWDTRPLGEGITIHIA